MRRDAYALVLLCGLLGANAASGDDRWPQFRGSGARGVSDDAGLPTTWSTTENVAWVTDIPGLGWSSPIVWDGTVFLTTVVSTGPVEPPLEGLYRGRETWAPSETEHRWLVYAIDVETGDVRWEREVHRGAPASGHHLKNTLASETAVTDGESIYAYFGNLGVFALDMSGELRWSHRVEPSPTRLGWGTAASPVLHGDRLYLVNDNDEQSYLVALSTATGETAWRTDRDEGTNWSTPYVWENELRTEIITTGSDKVRAYDLEGQLLWELNGLSSITIPTPFAAFGMLYLGSGYVADQHRPVYAIRPGASGDISLAEGERSSEFIAWSQPQAAPYNPSPLIYGDYYYTLLDRGFFTSHDARTGEEVYAQQRIRVGAAFTASPWAYDGKIFALSEAGDTYVIRAGPTFEVLGTNSLDEFSMATPAIAHGSLFIRTASKLYRITEAPQPRAAEPAGDGFVPVTDAMLRDPDPADWLMVHRTYDHHAYSPLSEIDRDNVSQLRVAWMRAMDEGPMQLRPLIYDGVMYVANPGGDHLQALDATTGDLIWDYVRDLPADLRDYSQLGDRTRNLALYGEHIYHLTADAYLAAIDARTGELAWESQMADYRDGITHSSGAMVVDGQVVSGRACSTREGSARCFIAGHDAGNGRETWRFYTAAGNDDPGGQTWGDVPTSERIHVSPWGLPGSYDPELGLVYWGIAVPSPFTRLVRRGTWDVGDRTPCELYSNSTVALNVGTGAMDWYYQHLPCDDWDQDFVQERTLIDTVVRPDPEAVRWINPAVADAPQERKIVVTMGEPGGLFVNDRETGEFLWASPLPFTSTEQFVIRDIDVETGQVTINMDLVAKEIGEQYIICGHNVKGYWSWSYSPQTGLLYIPFNRSCLNQTANDRSITGASPRFTVPEPGREEDGPLTDLRAIDISTGREVWRYEQRAPNAGSTLATGGNVVFHGDLHRRFRAFDAETGEVRWETILGSQVTGYPVTYAVDGRQYVTIPVGGGAYFRLSNYTPELEAPIGSNMLVTFALPE